MLISTIASVAHTAAESQLKNVPFRRDYRRTYEHLRRLQNAFNDNNRESQYALCAYIFHLLSLERLDGRKYKLEASFEKTFGNSMTDYLIDQLLAKAKNNTKLADRLYELLLNKATTDRNLAYGLCNCLLSRLDNDTTLADRLCAYLLDRLAQDAQLTARLFDALKTCQIIRNK